MRRAHSLLASVSLVALLALPLALPLSAAAQPATEAGEEPPRDFEQLARERKARQSRYPVNARISRYLAKAAEATDDGDYEKGQELLGKLNMPRLNPYERALVYRLQGYVAYASGDYAGTIAGFENVLSEKILSLDADNRIRFNIAQLYAAQQQWQNVITALDRWFRYVEEPTPLAYYLQGLSYFQLKELDKAIESTEKAIDLGEEPVESWLQLLAALFLQKEDYPSATPVLEELVMRFPKKQYWTQLSLIYGAREDYRHSLAVQQVAYAQGLLTEDKELRRLVRSYLFNELPHPAAQVLGENIEAGRIEGDVAAYEMLANSWIAARDYDKALGPLQTAADLAKDGALYVRLAQVHLQREEWDDAAEHLRHAIEKGGLDDPAAAELLLGIAYYESKRPSEARSAFQRARRDSGSRAEADRWITHIDNETPQSG